MILAHLNGVIAAVNKHKVVGIIAIIAGALVLGLGGLRVMKRMAGASIMAIIGLVVLVVGIILYTHAY